MTVQVSGLFSLRPIGSGHITSLLICINIHLSVLSHSVLDSLIISSHCWKSITLETKGQLLWCCKFTDSLNVPSEKLSSVSVSYKLRRSGKAFLLTNLVQTTIYCVGPEVTLFARLSLSNGLFSI